MLQSALNIPTLKAVVITNWFVAVGDPMYGLRPGYTYGPNDWLPISYETAADSNLGLTAWSETQKVFITYCASKKLAEKAAWNFYEREKPRWRLSTICPTYIGGPNILPLAKDSDKLGFSQKLIWGVATSKPEDKLPEVNFPGWVDVRDVAKAHILALQAPEAGGERFILASILTTYSGMADVLRREMGLSVSEQKQSLDCRMIDSSNCENILGMKEWVALDIMVLDTVREVKVD